MKAFIIVAVTLIIIASMFIFGMRNLRGKTPWDRIPKEDRKRVVIKGAIISIIALFIMLTISAVGKHLNPISDDSIWADRLSKAEDEEGGNPPVPVSEGYVLDDTVLIPVPEGFTPELEYDGPMIEFSDEKSGDKILIIMEDIKVSESEYSHYENYKDGSIETDLGTFFYNTYNKDGTPDSEEENVPMYSIHGMLKYGDKTLFASISSQKPDEEKYVGSLTDLVGQFKVWDR